MNQYFIKINDLVIYQELELVEVQPENKKVKHYRGSDNNDVIYVIREVEDNKLSNSDDINNAYAKLTLIH